MQKTHSHYRTLTLGVLALAIAGCSGTQKLAPKPVPQEPTARADHAPDKPLPKPTPEDLLPRPQFDDQPLISQEAPETPAFLVAYKAVNNPRIAIFVNRTLEGAVVPVNDKAPLATVEHTRKSSGPVTVDRNASESHGGPYAGGNSSSNDKFQSTGPADYKETASVYLKPGQYDDADAKALDYEAIENSMSEFIRSDGRVQIISPLLARQKLTDEQVKALESGRPTVLRELAQQLDADVLIHVTARPTKQTAQGLQIRIVSEAVNIRGGESLASAIVDVPPPLDERTIAVNTRLVGRKLIDGMTKTWTYGPPPGARQLEGAQPAPAAPVIPPPPSNAPRTDVPAPVPQPMPAQTMPPATMPER